MEGFTKKQKKRSFSRLAHSFAPLFAFILSISAVFTTCEVFMLPMSDFINEATGTAMGLGHYFSTPNSTGGGGILYPLLIQMIL